MQIVIDIPKEMYGQIKSGKDGYSNYVHTAIRNGTPFPKGHGRLIDADSLQKKYCDDNCGVRKCVDAMDRCVFVDAVLY